MPPACSLYFRGPDPSAGTFDSRSARFSVSFEILKSLKNRYQRSLTRSHSLPLALDLYVRMNGEKTAETIKNAENSHCFRQYIEKHLRSNLGENRHRGY